MFAHEAAALERTVDQAVTAALEAYHASRARYGHAPALEDPTHVMAAVLAYLNSFRSSGWPERVPVSAPGLAGAAPGVRLLS